MQNRYCAPHGPRLIRWKKSMVIREYLSNSVLNSAQHAGSLHTCGVRGHSAHIRYPSASRDPDTINWPQVGAADVTDVAHTADRRAARPHPRVECRGRTCGRSRTNCSKRRASRRMSGRPSGSPWNAISLPSGDQRGNPGEMPSEVSWSERPLVSGDLFSP
jgi:hypothetical protein